MSRAALTSRAHLSVRVTIGIISITAIGIGVVAWLAGLIRQSIREAQLSAFQNTVARHQQWYADLARDPELARIYADGVADPVETHVYLDTPEDEEFARTTLDMGEQTCFLHATCRTDLDVVTRVSGMEGAA